MKLQFDPVGSPLPLRRVSVKLTLSRMFGILRKILSGLSHVTVAVMIRNDIEKANDLRVIHNYTENYFYKNILSYWDR